jgi:hypothetical protein
MANRHVRRCGAIIAIALAALTASVAASTATASVVVGASKAGVGTATTAVTPRGAAKCVKRHGKRVRGCARRHHRSSSTAAGSSTSGGTTVGVSATFSTAPDCAADPLHVNCAQLPFDFVTTNDCITPPPPVEILGVYHVVAQTTENPDGTTTMKAYTNYQNSYGQTLTVNPTTYQANLTDHEYTKTDPTGAALDEAFDDNYELISNDATPNMIVHFGVKIHIDPPAIPTVTIGNPTAKCTG